jgi:hypothetical protein
MPDIVFEEKVRTQECQNMASKAFATSPLAVEWLAFFLSWETRVQKKDNASKSLGPYGPAHRLKHCVADEAMAADVSGFIIDFDQRSVPESDNDSVQPGHLLECPTTIMCAEFACKTQCQAFTYTSP